VKSEAGARLFAKGLYELLHSEDELETRFTNRCEVVAKLPRKQTRVLTWPLVTVFGFIAQPRIHFLLEAQSNARSGAGIRLMDFAVVVHRDLRDLRPRDMIDTQAFLWVQGSGEYPG
jgi:hypothetical protein